MARYEVAYLGVILLIAAALLVGVLRLTYHDTAPTHRPAVTPTRSTDECRTGFDPGDPPRWPLCGAYLMEDAR